MVDSKMLVFEERRTTIRTDGFKQYRDFFMEKWAPEWANCGGTVLCLLHGHMGEPPQELVQMTRFDNEAAWRDAQEVLEARDSGLIVREEVRLMRSIVKSRPKNPLPAEDHKPCYGYRRFFIDPENIDEVAALSEDGVWPRFEAHDCRIMGLWTPVAVTGDQEVLLITGYNSLAHWEETRLGMERPDHITPEEWQKGADAAVKRHGFTHRSWVSMMKPIYLEGQV